MKNLSDKKLALFFTRGYSLQKWEENGILDRELKPYQKLSKEFEQIYFFTYGSQDKEYEKELPENIKVFPNKWKFPACIYSFLMPFLYRKFLKKTDILKTNQMDGSWTAVLVKWLYNKKLAVRCGYEWLRFAQRQEKTRWKVSLKSFIERIAYDAADRIILSSKSAQVYVKKKFDISPSKIEIIPNYIDTNLFKPLDVEKEEQQVTFVGRLEKQKNLSNLIKAMSGLMVKLVIIGTGSLKEELQRLAEEKGVNIEFKQNIPNQKMPEELNKSTLFVLPSLYEGCPKVLLEAMSCELPCIGSKIKSVEEIIEDEVNGYLAETNSESLRSAIERLLENKKLRKKISKKARQTIENEFSLDKIVRKEVKLYQEL